MDQINRSTISLTKHDLQDIISKYLKANGYMNKEDYSYELTTSENENYLVEITCEVFKTENESEGE